MSATLPPVARVEIYTWEYCPYCLHAKRLLESKGVRYIEYRIDNDDIAREAMSQRAHGRRTLPQIFINDEPIGGYDELARLDRAGELAPRLATPPPAGDAP